MLLTTFLQVTLNQNPAADAALAGKTQTTLSALELAVKGGWVMIILALLLVIAVYIFFERYMALRNASKEDTNFMNRIKDYIHDGKIEAAASLCQTTDNPISRMIEKGISRLGRPLNDINTAVENIGNLEIAKLEKGLPTLATISGGAPMIGFLGTVIGMIRAFYDMSQAGNNIDVSLLSNGIYTAMVTTVGGLIVGILAYFAYNYLVARVEKVVYKVEARTTEFMDLLNEPVN
ncbi:MAG: biopolymer transporter ExbB [Bacteroidetes bacterium HGW-Bacteroidetes-4]|jgi:biopolymer transport protein ExbB|nr:MAG: biopolymer transporter ExbB [Bacteroidetes bacterium HGW-Bacteroidetes-4]